jgi:hypothetical protein
MYREGEIVWLALSPQTEDRSEKSIRLWPGLVADVDVEIGCNGAGHTLILHVYSVQFLTTPTTKRAYDWEIVPFLGHAPFDKLNLLAVQFESLQRPNLRAVIDGWKNSAKILETTLADDRKRNSIEYDDVMPSYLAAVHASADIALSYTLEWQRVTGSATSQRELLTTGRSYQGLWWGPECIRIFDLVRLKAERRQFPDDMQSCFVTPSESGPSAARCGFFMHIDAIHETGESKLEFPLITGMLYEVVRKHQNKTAKGKEAALLPVAPPGSEWKAVLHDGNSATISAGLIAG